jgi:adenylosuccinate synthase
MRHRKFNVVTDGQWGSTGKGLISSYLAWRHNADIISTTNMANAGHTIVDSSLDRKFIAKALPCPAILPSWYNLNQKVLVGPTAGFNIEQLIKEVNECNILPENLIIHPRAGVITDDHKQAEGGESGTKHLASTMQGCGTMLADKIMRKQDLKLARDYPELEEYIPEFLRDESLSWSEWICGMLAEGNPMMLHEGSQGFSLDISHGSHYPQCTSRSTTATQNITDMGLPADKMGDVVIVIRPYPIRVGNVVENGQTMGHSGGHYNDHEETTWKQVAKESGAPEKNFEGELTTVTKRLRRVFTFSPKQIRQACLVNGATQIALNFANYIDYECRGINNRKGITPKVQEFIERVEDITGVPVTLVGTGPRLCDVIDLKHGTK